MKLVQVIRTERALWWGGVASLVSIIAYSVHSMDFGKFAPYTIGVFITLYVVFKLTDSMKIRAWESYRCALLVGDADLLTTVTVIPRVQTSPKYFIEMVLRHASMIVFRSEDGTLYGLPGPFLNDRKVYVAVPSESEDQFTAVELAGLRTLHQRGTPVQRRPYQYIRYPRDLLLSVSVTA